MYTISRVYTIIGQTESFTMTFTKGGATDFARAFFRLTEGKKLGYIDNYYGVYGT